MPKSLKARIALFTSCVLLPISIGVAIYFAVREGTQLREQAAAQALTVLAAVAVLAAVVGGRREVFGPGVFGNGLFGNGMSGNVAGFAFVTRAFVIGALRRSRHAAVMRHRNGCEKPVEAQHAGEQEANGETQHDGSDNEDGA